MSTKTQMLKGETGVHSARWFMSGCLLINKMDGTKIYKHDHYGGHNKYLIVEKPTKEFEVNLNMRYFYPSIEKIINRYYYSRFQITYDSPKIFFIKKGRIPLMYLYRKQPEPTTYYIPDNGIIKFDKDGSPLGLDRYTGGRRRNTESEW